jgi:hypothetical protein
VAEIEPGCHQWLVFASITPGPILIPIGRKSPHRVFADHKVLRMGGWPSHLIFLERRQGEGAESIFWALR